VTQTHLPKDTDEITIEYLRPPDKTAVYRNKLLRFDERVIVSVGVAHPKIPVIVDGEVVLDTGYPVVWFVFPGEWYDLGKVYDQEKNLKGYYSDIIKPAEISGDTIKITDLFLDLWVSTEGIPTVLDEDEYDEAVKKNWIKQETAIEAREKLDRLIELVHKGFFPLRFVMAFEPKL
jgi:predicted RNA-binding protein associated with RNAse of E/G family